MELGNAESATAIKINGHSCNNNYAQGKTGFNRKNGGERHKIVQSGELVLSHHICEEKVTERYQDLHSIRKEETSGML